MDLEQKDDRDLLRSELLRTLLRNRSDYLNGLAHDDWSEYIDDLLHNALLLRNKDGCVFDDPGQDRDLFCPCSLDTFGAFLSNFIFLRLRLRAIRCHGRPHVLQHAPFAASSRDCRVPLPCLSVLRAQHMRTCAQADIRGAILKTVEHRES